MPLPVLPAGRWRLSYAVGVGGVRRARLARPRGSPGLAESLLEIETESGDGFETGSGISALRRVGFSRDRDAVLWRSSLLPARRLGRLVAGEPSRGSGSTPRPRRPPGRRPPERPGRGLRSSGWSPRCSRRSSTDPLPDELGRPRSSPRAGPGAAPRSGGVRAGRVAGGPVLCRPVRDGDRERAADLRRGLPERPPSRADQQPATRPGRAVGSGGSSWTTWITAPTRIPCGPTPVSCSPPTAVGAAGSTSSSTAGRGPISSTSDTAWRGSRRRTRPSCGMDPGSGCSSR